MQAFPISTAKWRVATNGGTQPRWRRDGKEIFYVAPDRGTETQEASPITVVSNWTADLKK